MVLYYTFLIRPYLNSVIDIFILVAHISQNRPGGDKMTVNLFICSILVEIIAYFLCKWIEKKIKM